MQLYTLALLLGICCTLLLPSVPSQAWALTVLLSAVFVLGMKTKPWLGILGTAVFGFSLMSFHINQHLAHSLPATIEGQKITVIGTISSVVEVYENNSYKFILEVSKFPGWNLPAKVQLSWQTPEIVPEPGDVWKLKVKLKRPRNYANPGSFDSEKFYFQQRIVGLGYVVDTKENQLLARNFFASPVNCVRQHLLRRINGQLANCEFAAVISSLVLGIKGAMPEKHLEILQDTGTVHLMAISGLHIGMIASMCFLFLRGIWRYVPAVWMYIPAPWLAACGAIITSTLYAALAGFAIATQRSLIMLLVFLAGILFKRKISSTHSYCLALLLVLLWDPFAVLSLGFWFSFIAVGFLIYAMRGREGGVWFRPQLVIAFALLPISLLFFSKASIIGPVANIIAIPWVSVAVLPISLIAVLCLPIFPSVGTLLLHIAEQNFASLWPLLTKLAQVPVYTWQLPERHLWLYILCAIIGALWFLYRTVYPAVGGEYLV